MNEKTWKEVDQYFTAKLHKKDQLMNEVMKANEEAEMPSIDVSPSQGKMLHMLVKMKGAKRILEIGTLGGYSSIWMARALPENGSLITLEYSEKHAEVARGNIRKAGLENKVKILTGAALDTLPSLKGQKFDFIFIDADKKNNPHYIKWAIELSEPGTVIITDNVVHGGRVIDAKSPDENIKGVRTFIDILSDSELIDSTAIQTVGTKGYDGFVIGIVKEG
ncbi:methyltransferase [[Bacillus] enclensis]|uniref:Predicted O-methyltransferase YrrM n=1 Tax=[Bacillus] enclensis TaxID=1402860 RepID=A0A0V8HJY1_9BACI|nr:O-methyltransferase [[Bacillus] enclensis]KSU62762.1 methyltransferase [[Bacillus] enclensis]SCC09140.1 Predicted O-methyltransferase YrrM [[Bacillus] enclensis]